MNNTSSLGYIYIFFITIQIKKIKKLELDVDFSGRNYFGYKVKRNKNISGTATTDNFETLNFAKIREIVHKQYWKHEFVEVHKNKLK